MQDMLFLYREGTDFVFMDLESYEQKNIPAAQVGEKGGYIKEGETVKVLLYKGELFDMDLPASVVLEVVETEPEETQEPMNYSKEKTFIPEYQELYLQNNDMVGWIKIEDTKINYPVMQSKDNPNFYLKHGFDKAYTDYGCPYVQENCAI